MERTIRFTCKILKPSYAISTPFEFQNNHIIPVAYLNVLSVFSQDAHSWRDYVAIYGEKCKDKENVTDDSNTDTWFFKV